MGDDATRWSGTGVPRGDDYDARWARMAAAGQSVHGEADFVSTFEPATVLDAGCGTGRVAIELAARGVATVGVDLDPGMLDVARRKAPRLTWLHQDLASLDLRDDDGGRRRFDVVLAAGNVMIFLAPGTEPAVVARLADHLAPGGHLVVGFQLGGDRLTLDAYDRACSDAGLAMVERHATWDGHPYAGGEYAVSVHARPAGST